ncbi:MAG: hypothetical protein KDK78_06565, partial [Chlamydiia bacterium]|nr:hypothetical protein [Chlamydiia bacterium]
MKAKIITENGGHGVQADGRLRHDPLFYEFLGREEEQPFWKELLHTAWNLSLAPMMGWLSPHVLTIGPLTAEQLNAYRPHFNGENNGACMLSASFSPIERERTGRNWSLPDRLLNQEHPHLLQWMRADEVVKDHIPLLRPDPSSESHWKLRRRDLLEEGIRLLILPINLGNLHWTSIHIDLEHRRIEYYDSKGGGNPQYFALVRLRLFQIQDWLARIDGERHYPVLPDGEESDSPSAIS